MLDRFSNKLLKKLNTICQDGYKVVDKEELADSLHVSLDVVENTLKEFEDLGYIDVKYTDESLVCLTTMTKGRQMIEVSDDKSVYNKKIVRLLTLTCILSCVFAFLGGLIGKLILG